MKKKKYDELFSIPCGISFLPCKPGSGPSAEEYAAAVKSQSSADSKFLSHLVWVFEQHAPSTATAFRNFWETVDLLRASELLCNDEADCLRQAAAGDLNAAQILVCKNPETIRLPFIQDAIIAFLKNQKYSLDTNLQDAKDIWCKFLTKRPRKKVTYHKENIRNLYHIRAQSKGKHDIYTAEKVAEDLGIKQSTVEKALAVKGRKGRPKKRK